MITPHTKWKKIMKPEYYWEVFKHTRSSAHPDDIYAFNEAFEDKVKDDIQTYNITYVKKKDMPRQGQLLKDKIQ